jgi:hypothetical protein
VNNALLRCDSVSDERITGVGSQAIVQISEEMVYVVTMAVLAVVVVARVVVAAAVLAGVVVSAAGVGSRLVVVVELVQDILKSMASLSTAAMSLIDVNSMSVVCYG